MVRGGAPFGKGDGGIRKNTFFNGKKRCQRVQRKFAFKLPSAARFFNKEGRDDFKNSFTHFIRDRYNLSYNVSNWIHETKDDIKPLEN